MAKPIIPRIIRGRLFYQVADVLFPSFRAAAQSHRLDILDTGVAK